MITDLIKLIVATIILNPLALIGIAGGVYIMHFYQLADLQYAIYDKYVIIVPIVTAFLYAVLFKHVYDGPTNKVLWGATIAKTLSYWFNIVFAAACTCAIIYAVNYGFGGKLDSYLRYENSAAAASVRNK